MMNKLPILSLASALLAILAACGDDQRFAVIGGCEIRPGTICLEANLAGANLTGAQLDDADLRRANLSGALLTDASLRSTDLRGANISGANLVGADMAGSEIDDLRFDGTERWGNTRCPNGSNSDQNESRSCIPPRAQDQPPP